MYMIKSFKNPKPSLILSRMLTLLMLQNRCTQESVYDSAKKNLRKKLEHAYLPLTYIALYIVMSRTPTFSIARPLSEPHLVFRNPLAFQKQKGEPLTTTTRLVYIMV